MVITYGVKNTIYLKSGCNPFCILVLQYTFSTITRYA